MQPDYVKPQPQLSPYVLCYWFAEHLEESLEWTVQRLVPSACTEMVFYYGDRAKCHKGEVMPRGLVCGHKTVYTDMAFGGKVGVLGVMFRPSAAQMLFGMPANCLTNLQVETPDVFGIEGGDLVNRIMDANSNIERIELIEGFLISRLSRMSIEMQPRIQAGVQLITQKGGQLPIKKLASYLHIGIRQLERLFVREVGLTPKSFSKIVRFQYAIALKQNDIRKRLSLTDISYEAGYTDQAHLIREFKQVSGHTPKQFFESGFAMSDYFTFF